MENNLHIQPKNTKSLKELYDSDQYHCWINAEGEALLPGDEDKHVCHEFKDLPEEIRHLGKEFWTDDLSVTVQVVSINGKLGVTLGFVWHFSKDILVKIPSSNVKETVKVSGIKFAEWMGANAPTGITVYYGDGTDLVGDEIVAFIPEHLCPAMLGTDCKHAATLVKWAWTKANGFLGIPKNYQFRADITTTVPTWALIEDVQKLRKALMAAHFSDYNSVMALKEEVKTTIECLECSIENDTSVPEGLAIEPSSSSLIAPDTAEGIIVRFGGSDIECAAGKPISHAMAGGVCQCDDSCPHFKECFTEDGMPRYGAIMPMQMNGAVDWDGDTIVKYLEENL